MLHSVSLTGCETAPQLSSFKGRSVSLQSLLHHNVAKFFNSPATGSLTAGGKEQWSLILGQIITPLSYRLNPTAHRLGREHLLLHTTILQLVRLVVHGSRFPFRIVV